MKVNKALVLIELANSIEEADKIIEEEIGITELLRKIKFLQENFEIQMIGHFPQTEDDYKILLNTIIQNKFRKGGVSWAEEIFASKMALVQKKM